MNESQVSVPLPVRLRFVEEFVADLVARGRSSSAAGAAGAACAGRTGRVIRAVMMP